MGNEVSQQEEEEFFNQAFEAEMDSPDMDNVVNSGTTAANCQPKHTRRELEDEGQEVGLASREMIAEREADAKYKRSSSSASNSSEKRKAREQKKLSYIQMAKLGYQELVNAIIRPPRADYKVSSVFV